MIFKNRGYITLIFLLLLIFSAFSQKSEVERVDVLGTGFDIRNTDPVKWANSTLISGKIATIVNSRNNTFENTILETPRRNVYFIESAHDYEKNILGTDALQALYRSEKSLAFSSQLLEGEDMPILVYMEYKVPLRAHALRSFHQKQLDSTFVDWVERLGDDVTIEGFVHNFGTHFASEIVIGGNFMTRLSIPRKDYIFSFYSEEKFRKKLEDYFTEADLPEDNLPFGNNLFFHIVGGEDIKTISEWEKTVHSHPEVIDVKLQCISTLLTETNFPYIQEIHKKRGMLDSYIGLLEENLKSKIKPKQESSYFRKFAIAFHHRVYDILKTESGSEKNKDTPFTGDIFFGGFVDEQTIIKSMPVINIGGIRIETLITDEKIDVDKVIELIVPPEHLEKGFVNVWDEAEKLIRGKNRQSLIITGDRTNRIYFKEALEYKITKEIDLETIDGDIFKITHSLEALRPADEVLFKHQKRKHVMDSELIATASAGDIERLKKLLNSGANKQAVGMVRSAIINKHPVSFFNELFDEGVVPTTADLDLLFDEDYFDPQIALVFLERGAIPKNNMIFKAVAYRQPNVVKALRRSGAKAMNNDLDFAIRLKDTALVNALKDKDVKKTENGTALDVQTQTADDKERKTVNGLVEKGEDMEKATDNFLLPVHETNTPSINQNNPEKNALNIPASSPESFGDSLKEAAPPIPSEEESPAPVQSKEDDPFVYKVKKGDVLVIIAKIFNVSVTQIKKWNDLNSSRINIDQKLLIYLNGK